MQFKIEQFWNASTDVCGCMYWPEGQSSTTQNNPGKCVMLVSLLYFSPKKIIKETK